MISFISFSLCFSEKSREINMIRIIYFFYFLLLTLIFYSYLQCWKTFPFLFLCLLSGPTKHYLFKKLVSTLKPQSLIVLLRSNFIMALQENNSSEKTNSSGVWKKFWHFTIASLRYLFVNFNTLPFVSGNH